MERSDCTPLHRSGGDTDRRLVILAPEDSVCIACTYLPAGTELFVDGLLLKLPQPIGLGHKVARRAIAVGEKIVKYGAKIGSATTAIAAGEHVHTHNMKSDYIPTFTPEDEQRYTGGRGA
jgi:hypothetical protein